IPVSHDEVRKRLLGLVSVEPKKGIDAVTLSVEGPYFKECQLITHTYAQVYLEYNLELSREDIQNVKNYLKSEKENKLNELNIAEGSLEDFQKRTGIVRLDEQAANLVQTISAYDIDKNTAEMELKTAQQTLASLREEYTKIDPELVDYVQAKLNEPVLTQIQKKIADLEIERDIKLSTTEDPRVRERIKEDAEKRISSLESDFDEQVAIFEKGIQSKTPEEKRSLSNDLLYATIETKKLNSRIGSLGQALNYYESKFDLLPTQSIELAKLERVRNSTEKLYLILEEKYQEAMINERSRLGNASVLDPGFENYGPVKPDRPRIMIFGAAIGLILGILFAFLRNYFDRTIKTPDDIENKGGSLLSWIPNIEALGPSGDIESEFVVFLRPTSAVSESFKALRTRIQYSKLESKPLQTLLITSSIPSEGKTLVSVNLAGSFAQAGKKVLLLDCDLRKPKVHTFFKEERYPGLSDYLFQNVKFEDIIRETGMPGLQFITSGTIPPNPSELLGSIQMKKFLDMLREKYDYIILDSPPLITVTDSEILFNITDGTVLIAQANKTPIETFWKTYNTLYTKNPHNLLGCVLNNFNFKSTYGYYYNYYYYYSRPEEHAKK
ncbi:MAG TPA: polysaccharide biosynthesis tyrosine autokinase, partial [Ignavibacteria bacterium]|nr:polysaccharide biosynthesis tyrosine autokinase [Ignavibacteria bacterium]